MKSFCTVFLVIAAVFASAGCGKKEITPLERKQALALASEADFALTIRDLPRAEGLLVKAAELSPDNPNYWLSLGSTRARLAKRDGARDAYKKGLKALQDAADKNKTQYELYLQQVYVLALLGRVDDARSLQTKLLSKHPESREIKIFVNEKHLDQLMADPQFKQIAL